MVECLSDTDRNGVFRIKSTENVFVIQQSDGVHTRTDEYVFTGVTLEPKGNG